ncbi:hypothetical protein GQ54DRAFT_165741 [Martensiomyces pterosporus]|nr:hypothetical protein GQ54DRAFT_165741 [Martensiomyces pterosporus]
MYALLCLSDAPPQLCSPASHTSLHIPLPRCVALGLVSGIKAKRRAGRTLLNFIPLHHPHPKEVILEGKTSSIVENHRFASFGSATAAVSLSFSSLFLAHTPCFPLLYLQCQMDTNAEQQPQPQPQKQYLAPTRPLPPVPPVLPAFVLPALSPASPPTPPRRRGSTAAGSSSALRSEASSTRATIAAAAASASTSAPEPPLSLGGGEASRSLHASDEHSILLDETKTQRKSPHLRRRALSGLFDRSPHTPLPQEQQSMEGMSLSGHVTPRSPVDSIATTASGDRGDCHPECQGILDVADESECLLASGDLFNSDSDDLGRDSDRYSDRFLVNSAPAQASANDSGGNEPKGDGEPSQLGRATTFTDKYKAEPAPGQWDAKDVRANDLRQRRRRRDANSNMPLEPDEYNDQGMPWIVEQMGMGERPLSSLFMDSVDEDIDEQRERRRKRKLAFAVLKQRVVEARIGIPKDPPAPEIESFKRNDGTVDYTSYWGSLIKHYADTQLGHKLDYRHDSNDPCKIDRFILTLQRLVEVSAPYQRFVVWLYRLARWDSPKVTAWWCLAYFILLYLDMIALFLWMTPVFIVAYHRLRPSHAYIWLGFERRDTSIIPSKVLKEASSGTIGKGLAANRLWDIWRETLGAHVQICLADLADWMERAKNCATWKRPWATRSAMVVMMAIALFAYFIPVYVYQKLLGVAFGVQFFFLAPLQIRYQRYRRILWILDWVFWHSPTDVELAVETIYSHNPGQRNPYAAQAAGGEHLGLAGSSSILHTVAADFIHAYSPFGKRRCAPVTILQTASSTSLDRLGDEATGPAGLYETIAASGRLGKKILGEAVDDEEYSGIGANADMRFPLMMGVSEEKQWLKEEGLLHQGAPRVFSIGSLGSIDGESIISQPTSLSRAARISQDLLTEAPFRSAEPERRTATDAVVTSSSDERGHDDIFTSSHTSTRSLMSRARALTARLRHKSGAATAPPAGGQADPNKRTSAPARVSDVGRDEGSGRSSLSLAFDSLRRRHRSDGQDASDRQTDSSHSSCRQSQCGSMSSNLSRVSIDSARPASEIINMLDRFDTRDVELSRHTDELGALGSRDAQAANDGADICSLYAFRCIHGGKYGTLFVTQDHYIFRRSRIMGGRRSNISSYKLSSVVAIRKSTGRFGKSHGIQLLLSSGRSHSFYGLGRRDDVFGFLLMRCGSSHVY